MNESVVIEQYVHGNRKHETGREGNYILAEVRERHQDH